MKKTLVKPGKKLVKPDKAASPSKPVKKALIKTPPPAPVAPVKKELVKATPVRIDLSEATGPVPVVPKKFKWKGKKDPRHDMRKAGFLHVLPSDMPDTFPSLHKNAPPSTFWRVHPTDKDNAPVLVTVLPDGVHIAWAQCTACNNQAQRCVCKAGILHPRSVEWCYIIGLMNTDGAEQDSVRSMPILDSTSHLVTSRALHHYRGKETGRIATGEAPRRPVAGTSSTPTPQTATKPANKPSAPVRKPLIKKGKRTTASVDQVDVSNIDLSKLNKDAAAAEVLLAEALTETLSSKKPVSKPLLKKGKK